MARECYFKSVIDQGQQKESFTMNVFEVQPVEDDQKLKVKGETRTLIVNKRQVRQ